MAQQGKHTVGSGKTAIEEQEERHEDRQEAGGELLSEQLAEQLRNQIVTDELKPGTPLHAVPDTTPQHTLSTAK